MPKVYVAGKLNDDAVGYIKNLNRMIVWSEKVRRKGFAVFVPGIDFLVGLTMGDLEYFDYFSNSQPWLAVADAVFLVPGHQTSKGTQREIEYANSLGIPVFDNLDNLVNAFNQNQ